MNFENQYLSYNEYKELGGTILEMPFNILEFEARKKTDERTQRRLYNVSKIPLEVKMCIYKLIEFMNTYEEQQIVNSSIASENIDGYSVTYNNSNNTSEIIKTKSRQIDDIITTYLINTVVNNQHILYLGVK